MGVWSLSTWDYLNLSTIMEFTASVSEYGGLANILRLSVCAVQAQVVTAKS